MRRIAILLSSQQRGVQLKAKRPGSICGGGSCDARLV
jgi:hypothetical protein